MEVNSSLSLPRGVSMAIRRPSEVQSAVWGAAASAAKLVLPDMAYTHVAIQRRIRDGCNLLGCTWVGCEPAHSWLFTSPAGITPAGARIAAVPVCMLTFISF